MTLPEKSTAAEAAKALGLGEAAPQVYEDLLQPMAKELGQGLLTLAKAVRIALAPVEGAVWSYEQLRAWLALRLTQKLSGTPPDRIVPPALQVAGPALLRLHFVAPEETLREMYANLLAAAMDSKRSASAHPSFVSILEQLSPDEALLLEAINDLEDEQLFVQGKGLETLLSFQWRKFCAGLELRTQESADTYLENLLRLRILQISTESHVDFHPAGHNRYGDYRASVEHEEYRTLELTALGSDFVATCVAEPDGADRGSPASVE